MTFSTLQQFDGEKDMREDGSRGGDITRDARQREEVQSCEQLDARKSDTKMNWTKSLEDTTQQSVQTGLFSVTVLWPLWK